MALIFSCVQCQTQLQVSPEFASKRVRCGKCSAVNVAPEAPHEDVLMAQIAKDEHAPDAVVV